MRSLLTVALQTPSWHSEATQETTMMMTTKYLTISFARCIYHGLNVSISSFYFLFSSRSIWCFGQFPKVDNWVRKFRIVKTRLEPWASAKRVSDSKPWSFIRFLVALSRWKLQEVARSEYVAEAVHCVTVLLSPFLRRTLLLWPDKRPLSHSSATSPPSPPARCKCPFCSGLYDWLLATAWCWVPLHCTVICCPEMPSLPSLPSLPQKALGKE